jgi:glucosyl-3-phosphoglycerate synthase
MPDFYQHARLPTLHHLADSDLVARETELAAWVKERPLALLLPALHTEFKKTALPRMLREIAGVSYISDVVITVNHATNAQMTKARAQCEALLGDKPFTLLWNDGPALQGIHEELQARGFPPYVDGKGTNIWTGLAYLKALGKHHTVASHDTDILSYERGMLWRLCYPVAHPKLPYRFAKGYYGRVGDRLFGRMTRLMIFPLLQTFIEVAGRSDLLDHLESFRYPLSGEFCAEINTLTQFPMPAGWGLEMCLLCETFQHVEREQMCQVDLGFNFEHRHRTVSNAPAATAATEGLSESAIQVVQTLASHVLASLPLAQSKSLLDDVLARYAATAEKWVPRYEHDSLINGLRYDADDERRAVHVFEDAVKQAFQMVPGSRSNDHPSVERVFEAWPEMKTRLLASAIHKE